jgi:hypothetical protein
MFPAESECWFSQLPELLLKQGELNQAKTNTIICHNADRFYSRLSFKYFLK